MNTAKVVMNGVKSNRMTRVVYLLGESIRQSRKPSHRRPHGQVFTFGVAGRNGPRIWLSANNRSSSSSVLRRTVTLFCFRRSPIALNQGCVIDIRSKGALNSNQVCFVSVSSELNPVSKSSRKILRRLKCTSSISRSDRR